MWYVFFTDENTQINFSKTYQIVNKLRKFSRVFLYCVENKHFFCIRQYGETSVRSQLIRVILMIDQFFTMQIFFFTINACQLIMIQCSGRMLKKGGKNNVALAGGGPILEFSSQIHKWCKYIHLFLNYSSFIWLATIFSW